MCIHNMWQQTIKDPLTQYADICNEIVFIGCLYLWWPLLLYRVIINGFHLTTHKLVYDHLGPLSCYSQHMNQFTLSESDWFNRVLGYNLQKGFFHEIPTHNPQIISKHYHLMPNIWNIVPDTTSYIYPEADLLGNREGHALPP